MPTLEAVAANAPSDSTLDALLSTSDDAAKRFILVVDGVPKSGKTVFSFGASKNFPGAEQVGKTPFAIDDMLFLTYENALDGMPGLKVKCEYVFDAINYMGKNGKTIIEANQKALELVHHLKGRVHTVVVDTLTSMDIALVTYADGKFMSHAGREDKFAMYRFILAAHRKFFSALRETGLNVIFNCHLKAVSDPETSSQAAKQRASGATTGQIEPAVSGSALNIYKANCTAILPVVVEVDAKTRQARRSIYTSNAPGDVMAGSRWGTLLDSQEPADLQHILKKVGFKY